ncbi:HK97 family phage prohead protease [Pseudoroseicyclus sp. CXY001]|uniref:HK97 family phage prohead protease n=1 Tax=Pseudoroseicyclus sp. CXY001 TaxID=3242492 RepID=UPI003570D569
MELERKFAGAGASVSLTEGHRIEGYASFFGQTDKGGDVVEPGAYAASLKRLGAAGGRVRMLWQHDPREVIGIWDEVVEDGKGLRVKGRLLTDVSRGREAAALIEAGAIDGLSIGYRTLRATKDQSGRRRLAELELWEVSLVTFPMLPEARVGAKGEAPEARALRDLAEAFRGAREALARD